LAIEGIVTYQGSTNESTRSSIPDRIGGTIRGKPLKTNRRAGNSRAKLALDTLADGVGESGAGQRVVGFEAALDPAQRCAQELELMQEASTRQTVGQMRSQGHSFERLQLAVK
jgi:hypothetical protein